MHRVGVKLNTHSCFCHGHFYTPMSRVKQAEHVRILSSRLDCKVKNPTVQDILDQEDIDEALNIEEDDDDDRRDDVARPVILIF